MFKSVHDIIPVNYLMCKRNIYKSDKCTFCKSVHVETVQHLFYDCVHLLPLRNIINTWFVSLTEGEQLSFDHILFRNIPSLNQNLRQLLLLIISDFVYIVWMTRNKVKFDHAPFSIQSIIMAFLGRLRLRILADFYRFPRPYFTETWVVSNNMFCSVDDDKVNISFM